MSSFEATFFPPMDRNSEAQLTNIDFVRGMQRSKNETWRLTT